MPLPFPPEEQPSPHVLSAPFQVPFLLPAAHEMSPLSCLPHSSGPSFLLSLADSRLLVDNGYHSPCIPQELTLSMAVGRAEARPPLFHKAASLLRPCYSALELALLETTMSSLPPLLPGHPWVEATSSRLSPSLALESLLSLLCPLAANASSAGLEDWNNLSALLSAGLPHHPCHPPDHSIHPSHRDQSHLSETGLGFYTLPETLQWLPTTTGENPKLSKTIKAFLSPSLLPFRCRP